MNTDFMNPEWEREINGIIRLIETEKDDGSRLYTDGDVRVGFKNKELMAFISRQIEEAETRVRAEERERAVEIVKKHKWYLPAKDTPETISWKRIYESVEAAIKEITKT